VAFCFWLYFCTRNILDRLEWRLRMGARFDSEKNFLARTLHSSSSCSARCDSPFASFPAHHHDLLPMSPPSSPPPRTLSSLPSDVLYIILALVLSDTTDRRRVSILRTCRALHEGRGRSPSLSFRLRQIPHQLETTFWDRRSRAAYGGRRSRCWEVCEGAEVGSEIGRLRGEKM